MAVSRLDSTLKLTEFFSRILSKLQNRRYPTIGFNQLSALLSYRRHLHKMALTRVDLAMKL
jgi:hypothetical protein